MTWIIILLRLVRTVKKILSKGGRVKVWGLINESEFIMPVMDPGINGGLYTVSLIRLGVLQAV
jgi:hypothetical protein